MVDLHVHYPMHLLGGVESPRDVAEQMLAVRAREAGKLRAAVLNVAARLCNFRHWNGDWHVSVPLLQQGGVKVACSVLYRPFSELDLDEPYGAPPESAYYDRLIELLDATERDIAVIGPDQVAIGSDLDGFIKPTMGGVESAADLKAVADMLRARHPESADRILSGNALRVISRRFASAGA